MVRRLLLCLALAAVLLPASLAQADVNEEHANTAWRSADQCAKDAFAKFPDYTTASNAKREVLRRECLRNHRLPDPAAATSNGGGS